ncbi:amino acid adenylation domain-containing protein [Streptomyces cinnabarinus]|uniref:Amino acid adenylation domain-containing protein n=1 Tax=Streptomyces cinnabarinus TaxID=67287 RepID=A0ABY7KBI0_9ACTN|nr:amino acid adenylation domain-containing protein [Streptomyces cinnabarinus]WAZ21838.1 amino acid adenylation domain-containing protein [Streptomyces cinnabarinus]
MSESFAELLPGPGDPAPAGAYGPVGDGPFPVPLPAGADLAAVVAGWAALLYHHTGRTEFGLAVEEERARPVVVRLAVEPALPWTRLRDTALRALERPEPCAGPVAGLPLLVVDGNDVLLRHDPAVSRSDAVARHAGHLGAVLAAALREPGTAVRELEPLSADERAALEDGSHDEVNPGRVERLFAERAAESPGRPAVVHGDSTLSYAELDHRAEVLASVLRAGGLRPGEPVALLLPREPGLVVAALAVLKAGGVYLPVDPDYPADRVALLLDDSGASRVVTSARVTGERPAGQVVVLEDLEEQGWSAVPDAVDAGELPGSEAPAYLMYTSGTTGRPKGVEVPHRGIVRVCRDTDYVPLDRSSRLAQIGATGFDASVWEIWGALLNGGTLHILDRETFLDVDALGPALAGQAVTTAFFTSALFHQLADEDPGVFRPLRDLLVGGDVVSAKHASAVLRACPGLRLTNMYGPTENVVFSTFQPVTEPVPARLPIGRPIRGTSAHVLNQDRRPLPVGVPGELYVGGEGMALGYHARPELTERAFVPHPFAPGRTLYRTGDRARLLPDGTIDFLGRVDHQVKVRGFRVEPGEVETALLGCTGVKSAVVLARRRPDSADSYLCAYLSGDGTLVPDEVREQARAALPPHMVPAHFMVLPALPLTTNGKVDRAALPEPDSGAAGADVAARDEVERALIELWEEILGVRGVGPGRTLQELGGTSLTATRIAARVARRFGIACPVSVVLRTPTLAALADFVRTAEPARGEGPRPGGAGERAPLSPQQHGIYVEQIKDPSGTEYNLPIVVDLPGDVDAAALRDTLAVLVARHEVLRTDIAPDEDGRPWQRVHDEPPVVLEEAVLPPGADPDGWTERWIRPFDPHRAPLWRAVLLRHADGARLVLDLHHLITDGYSLALLMTEWAALVRGAERLPQVELVHRDFARWATGPEGRHRAERQRGFWTGTFTPAPKPLDLPTDRPRPPVRRTEGNVVAFEFGAERSALVRELARTEGVTPFHVLLAAYTAFLGRVSAAEDVTVGVPVSGRHLPGVEAAQGMFVNTLALRVRPLAGLPFRAHLAEVARHALAAADHQDHGFADVVGLTGERDYSRHPLFDTLFAVQDTGLHQVDFLGGRPRWRPEVTRRTLFDLNLQIDDAPEGYSARWAYATALFLRPTVETFGSALLALLDAALAAPDTPLGELDRPAPSGPAVVAPDFDFDF